MAAVRYDLTIEQRATYEKPFIWESADDLTDYTAEMHIRDNIDSEIILLELNTENGRIKIEPVSKSITLYIHGFDTYAIDWVSGEYDLFLTSPEGYTTKLIKGKVKIEKAVTRGTIRMLLESVMEENDAIFAGTI